MPSTLYPEVIDVSTRPFEGMQRTCDVGMFNPCDPETEASLRPLEEVMTKLLQLLEERGQEWAEQSPPQRVESILQALRQL